MSRAKKPLTGPEEIHEVSRSQLSIARYYGGIKFNGTHYVYDPTRDVLIREDIHRERAKAKE